MSEPFLPYGRQEISDEDVAAVTEALRSPMITQGPLIDRFEQALGDYLGVPHVVAFANGTAALHGAAFAAGLGPGDELITSPITFAASANCALYMGASPRFADIDWQTWNLDTNAVAGSATGVTKAILPVSFSGLPVDLERLQPLRERGVMVIEDAAHALGAERDGHKVGGDPRADMATFSFHPVKSMTTGEGGAVTTFDDELARRLRLFRTHGITKEGIHPSATEGDWYYEMQVLGFNYRITDIQCALGLSQLKHVDTWVARRNEVAARYRRELADDERLELPPAARDGWLHGHHLFVVWIAGGAEKRLDVFAALRAAAIGVQVHYIPVYRLPYYRDTLGFAQDEWPNAERYYAGAISLPMFPGMTDDDVDRVVRELRKALA